MDDTKHIFHTLAKVLFTSLSFFLILVNILIISVALNYKKNIIKIPPAVSPEISQFAGCKSLAESCNSDACQYYSLCQSADYDYKTCKVYDCDKNYGIEIKTKNDGLLAKTYEKVSVETAKQNIEACKGAVKIINNKCENNISTVKVQVITAGNCSVKVFVYQQNGQFNSAVFNNLDNNFYALNISSCNPITAINAIGADGILIGSVATSKK